MSKSEYSRLQSPIYLGERQQSAWSRSLLLLFGLASIVTFSNYVYTSIRKDEFFGEYPFDTAKNLGQPSEVDIHSFNWSKLSPREDIEYTPCYDRFQCARLELPMDWHRPGDKTTQIAIIRLPAPVSIDDERYGGPIFTNPGGPGGSGVDFVATTGSQLQLILNSGGHYEADAGNITEKYYDIIGFDPRGTGFSTPAPTCFQSDPGRESWFLRALDKGIPGSSNVALGEMWAQVHAEGAACGSENDAEPIRHHVSTPYVARDMVEIVDKHALWKRKNSLKAARKPEQVDKLNYWGFSYGTVLGATFASMFPDRVGKLALDGVADIRDYYSTSWKDNLQDTEKTMQGFYDGCANAGPALCPLAEKDSTGSDIKETVDNLLNVMKHRPLPAKVSERTPEIITWSDVKAIIFIALYSPVGTFGALGQLLAQLVAGDGTLAALAIKPMHTVSCGRDSLMEDSISTQAAAKTILCTDGEPIYNKTIEEAESDWLEREHMSSAGGAVWSAIPLQCTGYTIRSHWQFEGPYGADNLATPILWVSNTADPVTPRANSFEMQKMFPGSRILSVDAPGHCSISTFSICAIQALRAYFHDEQLPAEDNSLVCAADIDPFLGPKMTLTAEEQGLRRGHRDLSAALERISGGFGQAVLGRRMDFSSRRQGNTSSEL